VTAPRLPDFVVIGAMKAATSTLHEQLARQPGLFMSDPKEPNFFSDDEVWARGLAWYGSLFEGAAPGDLRGESSTHYSKRPTYPRAVERMRAVLGDDVRLVYVMRHPVDRMISHYIHEWTERRMDGPLDRALDEHADLVDYGRYAFQLEPYLEAFGPRRVLPVFFERLTRRPEEELARVARFVGHRGGTRWLDDVERRNPSRERMRTSRVWTTLRRLPGSALLGRGFPALRDRVKDRWRMAERPRLDENRRRAVEAAFDADLRRLGRWLDLDLRCARFAEVAAAVVPRWSAAAPSPRAAGSPASR